MLEIYDRIQSMGKSKGKPAVGRLHLHPSTKVLRTGDNSFLLNDSLVLEFEKHNEQLGEIKLALYSYAKGYNNLVDGSVIVYLVFKQTKITISEVS